MEFLKHLFLMLVLTISFQNVGDQLIVDFHKLFVDLLVIFGILVPDERMINLIKGFKHFNI